MKFQFNDGGRSEAGYKGTAGDCVTRAIAIATGKPYQEVYDALNVMCKKKLAYGKSSSGVSRKVYDKYLKSIGWNWHPTMGIGTGCKVHLRDGEIPMGNIICRVSRHLVAVIDGIVNDNHNCQRNENRCVYGYYYKWELKNN